MLGLPSGLTALVLSMLGSEVAAAAWLRSNDGNPSASKYTDSETSISFLGYAPASTGFKFGMALPAEPSTDMILQLVAPLQDGGGWGGVEFGSEMTGYLMIVAWPDTSSKTETVKISPRIATGYEVSNGANLYTANNITLTPIASGTYVNDTHVSATFVCGGCITGGTDSFKSSAASATFSYAYALAAVADPSDQDTQLSDHTQNGELYGPFDVTMKDAESSEYASWAALTSAAATGTASSTASATAAAATAGSGSGSGSSGGSSSSASSASSSGGSSSSSSSSSTSTQSTEDSTQLSGGAIFAFVALGLVYVLQAVQIL